MAGSVRRWKKWLGFRLAAVLLGLLPLLLCEGILWLSDLPPPSRYDDPFVGFHRIVPLFQRSATGDRYEIPVARQGFFRPESFAARKGADEFRIFCVGGLTVQGNPWSTETSLTTWLELSLRAADPSRQWEVINCGGISYASYRLAPIVEEVLQYQPDLIVICSGHNEFLEDRTYATVRDTPKWLVASHRWLWNLRSYRAVRRVASQWAEDSAARRTVLPQEVETLLDYRGGLEQFQRNDERARSIVRHFEFNLQQMVEMVQSHQVPVMLVAPASDLKDTPPFKIGPSSQLSGEEQARLGQLWEAARKEPDAARRVQLLLAARRLDPRHAGVHFLLGKSYESLRWPDEAYDSFVSAKDEDICPLRMLEPLYAALERVSRRQEVPWLDMRQVLAPQCDMQILGSEIMVDHVHPTIEGYQLVGLALLQKMCEQGWVQLSEGWEQRRQASFRRQMASLDEAYFARGREHLEGLRMWASGRSFRLPPQPATSPEP